MFLHSCFFLFFFFFVYGRFLVLTPTFLYVCIFWRKREPQPEVSNGKCVSLAGDVDACLFLPFVAALSPFSTRMGCNFWRVL